MLKKFVLPLLLSLWFGGFAQADATLRVAMVSSQIEGSTEIGKTLIDGLGEVSFVGSKYGNQVVVHARGPEGEVIGKAETVVGLRETPIYLLSADGLKKVTIFWGSK